MTVGERLRRLREEAGFTQKGLAEALGVESNTVWRWENDKAEYTVSTLIRIAEALAIEPSVLLYDAPEAQVNSPEPEAQCPESIVLEWSAGAGSMRVVLPPTEETYRLLERHIAALSIGQNARKPSQDTDGDAADAS